MFGTLRLIFSLLVADVHTTQLSIIFVAGHPLNFGVASVVGFYMMAGYIARSQWVNTVVSVKTVWTYLVDKWLRLFPQLWLVGVLTLLLVPMIGRIYEFTAYTAIGQILLFPLVFLKDHHSLIMPATWAMGTIAAFYLISPILMKNKSAFWVAYGVSFGLWCLAAIGVLHPVWWGYRFLPSILFTFLTGSLIYDVRNGNESVATLASIYLTFLSMLWVTIEQESFLRKHISDVVIGLVACPPIIYGLSHLSHKVRVDQFLGRLSYGVFLSHFTVAWVGQYLGFDRETLPGILFIFGGSILIALVADLTVERLATKLRYRVRKRLNST